MKWFKFKWGLQDSVLLQYANDLKYSDLDLINEYTPNVTMTQEFQEFE